jgi:hypothetical protein
VGGGRQRRSKTRRGPRRLGHRHGRDAFSLGRGWRREGITGGVVGAKSNEGAGKNSAGDEGGTLLKWCSGEAMEGGVWGAIRPWGLAPTGVRRPDRIPGRPRRVRAARLCLSRGAPGATDAWALASSRRGREERGVGRAWADSEKTRSGPGPDEQ